MSETLFRIKQYLDYKGLSLRAFEASIGVSNGAITSQLKPGKTIGVDRLEHILKIYEELNPDWALTGKGSMIRSDYVSKDTMTVSEKASKMSIEGNQKALERLEELYEVNKKYTQLLEEKLKATQKQLQELESNH
jgi:transcriptional regulator with XRE-family HTH domain